MRYKNALLILSIAVAVLLPLSMALKAQFARMSSPAIQVKINTYDPRDLFYGQYMTYRFDWNWKGGSPQEEACEGENCCLCVGDGAIDPEVSLASCDVAKESMQCRHVIEGEIQGSNFDPGFNRYYVDERHAYPLEQLFFQGKETFRIGLGLQSSGKAIVQGLYINDQSLDEYIRSHGGTVPSFPDNSTP